MRAFLNAIFPSSASNFAPQVDHIYFALLLLCGSIAFLVFVVATLFCIRYRRGSKADRTPAKASSTKIEIVWTVIPFSSFSVSFFGRPMFFFGMSRPPANATEIYIVGKQWMWKIQHPDGRREINELHLPVGQPVKLIMTSQDVIHDFFIPGFRNKQDVVPGRYTTEWFTPTKPGQYHIFCAQYCGTDHSKMIGTIYVMEPAEHAKWQVGQPAPDSLVGAGERRFAIAAAADVMLLARPSARPFSMVFTGRKFRSPTARWSLLTTSICATRSSFLTSKSPPVTSRSCRRFRDKSARKNSTQLLPT